jgi:hypothetical protein
LDPQKENKDGATSQASGAGSSNQPEESSVESTEMGELRAYVEMKREVTVEVYDSILEKLKDLKFKK